MRRIGVALFCVGLALGWRYASPLLSVPRARADGEPVDNTEAELRRQGEEPGAASLSGAKLEPLEPVEPHPTREPVEPHPTHLTLPTMDARNEPHKGHVALSTVRGEDRFDPDSVKPAKGTVRKAALDARALGAPADARARALAGMPQAKGEEATYLRWIAGQTARELGEPQAAAELLLPIAKSDHPLAH